MRALWIVLSWLLFGLAALHAKPNIVIIMADDLGYGDLSCYGGWIQTPHIDRLAAEGLRFTDWHASGNVCSPTRAGLMTGRYQQRAGLPGVVFADPKKEVHFHGLAKSEWTLAEAMKGQGYATAIFGKWHLGYFKKFNPVRNGGFDEFKGYVSGNVDFFSYVDQAGNYDWWHDDALAEEKGYVTTLINQFAVDFVTRKKDQPFFLYLPHEAPHYPFQGPNDKPFRVRGTASVQVNQSLEEDKRAYREMVEEMDKGVGMLLDTLKQHGLAENTLVFFISDNGAAKWGSNAPLRGMKGNDWEGGHRVPGIAWWPGRIKPGVTDELAISLDLFPTFLALAGGKAKADRPFDGIDLSPLLFKGQSLGKRTLHWNGMAVRQGDWKLMRSGKTRRYENKKTELFNLKSDLSESTDLSEQYPGKVKAMTALIEAWNADMKATATPQPAE